MLIILWLMQTVLLDSIYALYTKETMKEHSKTISENIDNPELDSLLISISQENEISIYILSENGMIKSATERSTSVRFDKASKGILEYWNRVQKTAEHISPKLNPPAFLPTAAFFSNMTRPISSETFPNKTISAA